MTSPSQSTAYAPYRPRASRTRRKVVDEASVIAAIRVVFGELFAIESERQRLLEEQQELARRVARLQQIEPCAICRWPAARRAALEADIDARRSLQEIAARHEVSATLA